MCKSKTNTPWSECVMSQLERYHDVRCLICSSEEYNYEWDLVRCARKRQVHAASPRSFYSSTGGCYFKSYSKGLKICYIFRSFSILIFPRAKNNNYLRNIILPVRIHIRSVPQSELLYMRWRGVGGWVDRLQRTWIERFSDYPLITLGFLRRIGS